VRRFVDDESRWRTQFVQSNHHLHDRPDKVGMVTVEMVNVTLGDFRQSKPTTALGFNETLTYSPQDATLKASGLIAQAQADPTFAVSGAWRPQIRRLRRSVADRAASSTA
jgi:hypothetical protein